MPDRDSHQKKDRAFKNPNDFLRERMADGKDFVITAEEAKQIIYNTHSAFNLGHKWGFDLGYRVALGKQLRRLAREMRQNP